MDSNELLWPMGRWKGYSLRRLPISYLNWFLAQPTQFTNPFWQAWRKKIVEELVRRHSVHVTVHFTEHSFERFTQFWPRFISHYQNLVDKKAGVVTLMRRLFIRALEDGITIPDSKSTDKFTVIDKKYKWVYTHYELAASDLEEKKVVTIAPINYKE